MSNVIKCSSSSLFISYGADPNYHEPQSTVMNKDEMLEYASRDHGYSTGKFSDGEIICEVRPIGFFYKNENGDIVQAEVEMSSLEDMLLMQSSIYDREMEHVPTMKYQRAVVEQEKERIFWEMESKGARFFADENGYLDEFGVEKALHELMGYDWADIRWNGNICIVADEYSIMPSGEHCGMSVYDPWEVDRIPKMS